MSDDSSKRFARRIEPYLDKLYRAAYRLTHNRANAEELFQDTCVRAFSMRVAWEATESPLGWLMRVQYNLFIDEVRKNNRSVVVPIADVEQVRSAAGSDCDPEESASNAQTMETIQKRTMIWGSGQPCSSK